MGSVCLNDDWEAMSLAGPVKSPVNPSLDFLKSTHTVSVCMTYFSTVETEFLDPLISKSHPLRSSIVPFQSAAWNQWNSEISANPHSQKANVSGPSEKTHKTFMSFISALFKFLSRETENMAPPWTHLRRWDWDIYTFVLGTIPTLL
ncbi:anthocyanidin 5,3-O-glucosyltransferase [Corchorus olitorius]|uniref:Anthocyanidin 5,3-O-glucosyltransferase n=1 Tax=Corchorus olitorius TaxID=93759 RepID=A0A1R3K9Q3_9ROSI|nr:anthocyanidin 5,3-O-glucosyltransferase [Corchorus olitorius]